MSAELRPWAWEQNERNGGFRGIDQTQQIPFFYER
nr:MAG TPA: hypothetical protein [Caudoviricetes sp.]